MDGMVGKLVGLVVAGMVVAGLAVFATTVVVTVVAMYGLYRGGRALHAWLGLKTRQRAADRARQAHQRAELLARAELQHRWYLDGDPRGIYGRYVPSHWAA